MTLDRQHVATLAVLLREAAGHLIAGRDSSFIDVVEQLAIVAKGARREAARERALVRVHWSPPRPPD